MKAKSKKFQTPTLTPTIKQAFKLWLGGVGRGELVKKFDLGITYGALGRAFKAMNPDKKWSELKALHDSKGKKSKKEAPQAARRAA